MGLKGLQMGASLGESQAPPPSSAFRATSPLSSSVRGSSLRTREATFATGGGAMLIGRGSVGLLNGRVSQELSSPHSE